MSMIYSLVSYSRERRGNVFPGAMCPPALQGRNTYNRKIPEQSKFVVIKGKKHYYFRLNKVIILEELTSQSFSQVCVVSLFENASSPHER